jgi:hypothetical protein
MATMTGLDAATRARLTRDSGATHGLLDYLEAEGYEPGQITSAFAQMSVEAIANRVGYDLAGDPDYRAPAGAAEAAPAPAPLTGVCNGRVGYPASDYDEPPF